MYKLPDLPYDYAELEPVISAEIMQLHHQKHHNTYVTKLNEALEQYAAAEQKHDVAQMIAIQSAIRFNGGGHVNHSIFWKNLAPVKKGGGTPPKGALLQEINKNFGSLDNLIENMTTKTAAIQGSGWGWLGYCKNRKMLCIQTCANQDPLSTAGLVPLLGLDVWEHAYYLQYKNVRADYLKQIWKIVNWHNVEENFNAATK